MNGGGISGSRSCGISGRLPGPRLLAAFVRHRDATVSCQSSAVGALAVSLASGSSQAAGRTGGTLPG
jgi:hypothetical protein